MAADCAFKVDSVIELRKARFYFWLQCPACGSKILTFNEEEDLICCDSCNTNYPGMHFGKSVIKGKTTIPVLFPNPSDLIQGWTARLNGFQQKTNEEISRIQQCLKDSRLSDAAKKRLKRLLEAKQSYIAQMTAQLQFFSRQESSTAINANAAIAKNQGVDSYINNLFRDWSWENGENAQLINCVNDVLPKGSFEAGAVATLGAGAARFSYDFHYQYDAEYSLLIDINPFLLSAAARIISGEELSFYEFPVAPLSADNQAVLKKCALPAGGEKGGITNFGYILADAISVPLQAGQLDTILTPWLIDIIPCDFRDLIPHINRLLKKGGVWCNTGSLAFMHANESWNYDQNEVIALLEQHGFEVIKTQRRQIDYLQSPHSAHGRRESVFTFSAKKVSDTVPPKPYQYLPNWLTDYSLPIPKLEELAVSSSKHLLQAQVLSAIDGTRSIEQIGELLAKQYGLSRASASVAVRQVLMDNYKS